MEKVRAKKLICFSTLFFSSTFSISHLFPFLCDINSTIMEEKTKRSEMYDYKHLAPSLVCKRSVCAWAGWRWSWWSSPRPTSVGPQLRGDVAVGSGEGDGDGQDVTLAWGQRELQRVLGSPERLLGDLVLVEHGSSLQLWTRLGETQLLTPGAGRGGHDTKLQQHSWLGIAWRRQSASFICSV